MNNIFLILAEVGILLILFLFFYGVLGRLFKQLSKVSLSPKIQQTLQLIRQNLNSLLVLSWGLLSLATIGINSWWIYQGKDIQEYTIGLVRQLPPEYWQNLAIGTTKSLTVLILVGMLLRPIQKGLKQISKRAKQFQGITVNDESIEKFFNFLDTHFTNTLWLSTLLACTYFLELPTQVSQYSMIALKVYVIIVAGLLLSKAVTAIIESIDALSEKYSQNIPQLYHRLRHLIPFLQRCVQYAIYVSTATVVLQQVEVIANLATIGPKIVRLIGVIFLCRIAIEVAKILVEEVFLKHQDLSDAQRQRRLTLIPLIQSGIKYLIYFGGGMIALKILSIDPTPILAAAGILGLAISFGAQNLVNDIVSGFFILFENYYLVGDFIEVGNAAGTVEAIELRTTHIRHPNGQVYIVRNGDVTKVVNYSKDYVRAIVDVRVTYDSNLTQVYSLIEEVGQQLLAEYDAVVEPTEVAGAEDLGESEILIRTSTKVKPGKHLQMQRVFRKAIKEAFEQHGVKVPYARQVWVFESIGNGN